MKATFAAGSLALGLCACSGTAGSGGTSAGGTGTSGSSSGRAPGTSSSGTGSTTGGHPTGSTSSGGVTTGTSSSSGTSSGTTGEGTGASSTSSGSGSSTTGGVSSGSSSTGATSSGGSSTGGSTAGGGSSSGGSVPDAGCLSTSLPGECESVLASGLTAPNGIAAGGGQVYWDYIVAPDAGSGAVASVGPSGGAPRILAATGDVSPFGMVLSGSVLAWGTTNGIAVLDLDGGTAPATYAGSPVPFTAPAVAQGWVYWADGSNAVMGAALTGGQAVALAPNQPQPLVVTNGQKLVWLTTTLNWSGPTLSYVQSLQSSDLDGGNPATLQASFDGGVVALAVDGAYVYWSQTDGTLSGEIDRCLMDGGSPTVVASGLFQPSFLAVDAQNVYWIDGSGGAGESLMKAPLAGGSPATIADDLNQALFFALDDSSAYWTSPGDGTVVRLMPK